MPPKGKTAGKSKSSTKGASAARGGRPGRRPPPPITTSRPKPWGLIAMTAAVVLFAAGVIGYALVKVNEASKNTPEAKAEAARSIQGVVVKDFPGGQHNDGVVKYAESPPMGGQHANQWADCTGTVYPNPIRQENAVHSLEHGSIWITYRPGLAADQVDALKKKVDGVEQMLMSPYPGLKSAISLQAWGHQLAVDNASDARIDEFIDDLRLNPTVAPEPNGTCVNPQFKASPLPPDPTGPAATPSGRPTSSGSAPAPTPTQG
jgi:Protein of unknown function (DUF3105)